MLRYDQTMSPYDLDLFGKPRKPTFGESIMLLIGHIAGSTVLFLSIVGATWLIGVTVHWLNDLHAFDPEVLAILTGVEITLVYVDIALSGIVLVVGAFRFIKELSGFKQ